MDFKSNSSQVLLDTASSFRKSVSNKVDYLYEITVIPESQHNDSDKSIIFTNLPLIPILSFCKGTVFTIKDFQIFSFSKKTNGERICPSLTIGPACSSSNKF